MKPAPELTLGAPFHRNLALEWLLIGAALLTTLSATLGLQMLYYVFKPLTMLLAMVLVVLRARRCGALERFDILLLLALLASMAGDIFLMLPGNYFLPGLASFLVAHFFYIAVFRQNTPWFPSHRALAGTLAAGAAMYIWVWTGLNDPVLKLAVATYVTVIALMVAQAIGRATVQKTRAANAVAWGACAFMLSDSLIAINRFVQPLPLVSLWVLGSYYLAQILMVQNARPTISSLNPSLLIAGHGPQSNHRVAP